MGRCSNTPLPYLKEPRNPKMGVQEITPAPRPVYDDQIDNKDEKDFAQGPGALGFGSVEVTEAVNIKKCVK